jgi:hypothetical protein
MTEEPFFSKEMHDNHIKALAQVTKERDDALAEIARLREALSEYVYETTHLSPEREGLHHCRIPNALLEQARAALKPDTGEKP